MQGPFPCRAPGGKAAAPTLGRLVCHSGQPLLWEPPGQHFLPAAHLDRQHLRHLLKQLSGLRRRHFPRLLGGFCCSPV